MESIVEISRMVLLIGGALCVIALFVLLLYVITLVMKAKTIVNQTQQTYQQAMMFALAPLQKLTDWLSTQDTILDDEDDEDR